MPAHLTELVPLRKPTLEPLAVQEVMDYMRAVPQELDFVRILLTTCRETLEGLLGVAFCTQQLQATFQFPEFPTGLVTMDWNYDNMLVTLPRPPLQMIDDVAVEIDINKFSSISTDVYDSILQFPAEVYFFGDAFGMVEYPWWINLNREPRVRIKYTCGYASTSMIPGNYKLLLYQYIASMYLNRENADIPLVLSKSILANKVMVL